MAKGKSPTKDINKIISSLEEKLSIAKTNKNNIEMASINRLLDYWKKKKEAR